ncbi:MAG: hypothetical protein JSR66_23505 [Proteobacteria bacterium]|nr:hypothetical protein [Pseudomonadota bacterium]
MVEKYVRHAVHHCHKRLTETSAEPPRTRKLMLVSTAALCALLCASPTARDIELLQGQAHGCSIEVLALQR